jgi:hypothetical protein
MEDAAEQLVGEEVPARWLVGIKSPVKFWYCEEAPAELWHGGDQVKLELPGGATRRRRSGGMRVRMNSPLPPAVFIGPSGDACITSCG